MVTRILMIGDQVRGRPAQQGGYHFAGEVRAVFTKRNGVVRYVIENDDGILRIYSAADIQSAVPKELTSDA